MTRAMKTGMILSLCGLSAACSIVVMLRVTAGDDQPIATGKLRKAKVERVYSGHKIKLSSGEDLIYAGIRAPYADEPLYVKARRRNAELVVGETIRLRFDKVDRDRKGRLSAYVTADGALINEALVREGLAYVRLTPDTQRFADMLLSAQAEARREQLGLWRTKPRSARDGYAADPKYGNFHKLRCDEVDNMKPERRVNFKTRDAALDQGFAPCRKCQP